MRVLIAGGSGLVGRTLAPYLLSKGFEVTVLTHRKKIKHNLNFKEEIKVVKIGDPLGDVDVIVNLAGERISTYPLTKRRIKTLLKSRLDVINFLKERYKHKLSTIHFLQASATGIYVNTKKEEDLPKLSSCVYSNMCKEIESAANKAFLNCSNLRLGVVVGNGGGIVSLLKFLPKIKFTHGDNCIPYIKNEDVALAIYKIITNKLTGNVNLCSNKYLSLNELLELCQKEHFGPKFLIPKILLKLDKRGALLLPNQKIKPQKLLNLGINFR